MVHDYINLSSFSNREIDKNGFMHVKNCIVTKSEVNQYRGDEIPEWQSLGLDPNKIYDVLRPAEEIEKSLTQMSGLPILDDHDDEHDAEHPKTYMRIGSMGTNPEFSEPEASTELTFWNKKEIDEINTKQRDNLSMGYDYVAVLENGEYNGKKYQVRMKDLVWNHVALVDKGRVDGAKVSDRNPFSQKEAERRLLPNKKNNFMERLVASYRDIFAKDRDMATKKSKDKKPMTPVGAKKKPGVGKPITKTGKYEDTREPNEAMGKQLGRRVAGDKKKLPMAGSRTGDRNMATKKKRNGDAIPAGGEGEEEIKENRVIAGLKALASEFDNIHEEAGIDPGMTDDEQGALQKVQDFLDSFHNQGSDEPGEEAGTGIDPMDEDPDLAAGDEEEGEESEGAEDECWEDVEKPKSPTGDKKRRKGMDAAMIEKRITAKFKAKDRALDECADLIGSVSKARVLDSALDVYAHALKNNGIEIPKGANLDGLRGMVMMLKKSRVGDSMPVSFTKPTGVDAQVQETIANSPYAPRY